MHIINKNMNIKKLYDHIYENGKLNPNRTHSYYIQKYFKEIYSLLLANDVKYSESQFKEKLYCLLNKIEKPPKCKNPLCSKDSLFLKFSRGYSIYCSMKCAYENFGNNKEVILRISNFQKNNRNKKFIKKYGKQFKNLEIKKDIIILNNYCQHGNLSLSFKDFKNHLYHKSQTFCRKCHSFYIKEWKLLEKDIEEQYIFFTKLHEKSRYNLTEKRVKKYFPKLYKAIIIYVKEKMEWAEKIYRFKEKVEKRPICINCNLNEVHFLESIHQYSKHCKICCKNGDFVIQHKNFISKKEEELFEYIQTIYDGDIIRNKRINNNELDIYIPDLNIGIEFNGLYWHSDIFKDKNYHLNKNNFFQEKNIQLITVWEDDWINRGDIIKSIIKNKLGKIKNRIYARKCFIKEISSKENMAFCNDNHIQTGIAALIKLGLFYKKELVSVMTFGKNRIILGQGSKEGEYELLRFCNKIDTSVIGGASKLFKYFLKNYNPQKIISYANLDISNGNIYNILGFQKVGNISLNYWWAKDGIKYHRSKFMKHKLVEEGADPLKTENEIMKNKKFYKIYGTGNLKYEWNREI